MELRLEPERPRFRKNGAGEKMVFNKGYTSPWKGSTFESYFGKERAEEIRCKMSRAQAGKKRGGKSANAKPVVAIENGRLVARYNSSRIAAQRLGVSCNTISRWLQKRYKCRLGWSWYFEADPAWMELVNCSSCG